MPANFLDDCRHGDELHSSGGVLFGDIQRRLARKHLRRRLGNLDFSEMRLSISACVYPQAFHCANPSASASGYTSTVCTACLHRLPGSGTGSGWTGALAIVRPLQNRRQGSSRLVRPDYPVQHPVRVVSLDRPSRWHRQSPPDFARPISYPGQQPVRVPEPGQGGPHWSRVQTHPGGQGR